MYKKAQMHFLTLSVLLLSLTHFFVNIYLDRALRQILLYFFTKIVLCKKGVCKMLFHCLYMYVFRFFKVDRSVRDRVMERHALHDGLRGRWGEGCIRQPCGKFKGYLIITLISFLNETVKFCKS